MYSAPHYMTENLCRTEKVRKKEKKPPGDGSASDESCRDG